MNHLNKNLVIWDKSDEPPQELNTILWQGSSPTSNYSIQEIIEEDKGAIREEYLNFIYRLGEKKVGEKKINQFFQVTKDFNLWWMTPLAEKSPYRKNSVTDAIKLIALERFLTKENILDIDLYSKDARLQKSLQIICKKNNINLSIGSFSTSSFSGFRKNFKNFKLFLRSLFYIIRKLAYLPRYQFKKTSFNAISSQKNAIFILSYFDNLSSKELKKDRFKSNYWYEFPEFLNSLGYPVNWFHHFVPSNLVKNLKQGNKYLKCFSEDSSSQIHNFLDESLATKHLMHAFYNWIRLVFGMRKVHASIDSSLLDDRLYYIWPFLEEDWYQSIYSSNCVQNLIWHHQFDCLLERIPSQQTGLYLQENQNWEYAFIHAWKKHNHGTLVGVVHTPLNFWDLRFFENKQSIDLHLHPDKVAMGGKISVDNWLNGGLPQNKIIKVESLRYLHLVKYKDKEESKKRAERPGDILKNILILGDVMPDTTNKMMRVLCDCSDVLSNFKLSIRSHPNNPIHFDRYPQLDLIPAEGGLDDELNKNNFVICTSYTSSSLEAYLAGLKVLNFVEESAINFSPLSGLNDICFIKNKSDLAESLIERKDPNRHGLAEFFYLDKEFSLWKKALEV